MKERVLAVFGALALIAAAFVVRSLIAGDGGSSNEAGGSGSRPVVACTNDLMAVCAALADEGAIAADPPTVELGSTGAKTATVDDVALDGWITWDPAPALATFDAGSSKAPWNDELLALSTDELATIGTTDTLSGLKRDCDGTWACIANSGLQVGFGQPTTAQGIARLSPLATPLADDLDPLTLDTATLKDLLNAPVRGQASLAVQLKAVNQPGSLNLVVGPKTILDRAAATPQGRNRNLQVSTPEPTSTITVVLATSSRSQDDLTDLVTVVRSDALAEARDAVGMTAPPGGTVDPALAGFLYQVRNKVG